MLSRVCFFRVCPVGVCLFAQRGNMTLLRFVKTVFRRVKLQQMALNMFLIIGVSRRWLCHPENLVTTHVRAEGRFQSCLCIM